MEFRPIISALLRNKVAPLLVAMQIAISLAILSNALYIINLRLTEANRPSGIVDEHDVFYLRVNSNRDLSNQEKLNQDKYFYEIIAALPAVASVADVSEMPMSRSGSIDSIRRDPNQDKASAQASIYTSARSLVKPFGLKLIAGRDLTAADVEEVDPDAPSSEPSHVIITADLAKRLFPDQTNVIGKQFYWGGGSDAKPTQIVGVVERLQTPRADVSDEGWFSILAPKRRITLNPMYVVRAEPGQRDRLITEVEAALRKADNVPLRIKTYTVDEDRKDRYGTEMTMAWMLIIVSVLLVIITASGIVGMTSLWVTQRKKHIGVRRALGARKIDILRYFITENLIIGCVGVLSGAFLAIGLNDFLVSELELSAMPPEYVGVGALLFLLLGLAAAYAPSWRAAGISPAVATRST